MEKCGNERGNERYNFGLFQGYFVNMFDRSHIHIVEVDESVKSKFFQLNPPYEEEDIKCMRIQVDEVKFKNDVEAKRKEILRHQEHHRLIGQFDDPDPLFAPGL